MSEIETRTRELWLRLRRNHRVLPPMWATFDGFVRDMGYAPTFAHTLQRLEVRKPWNSVNGKWIDPAKGKGEHVLGRRFGMLRVVDTVKTQDACLLICKCDCGDHTKLLYSKVIRGVIRSCGCLVAKAVSMSNKRHGQSNTATYRLWSNMHYKCRRESHGSYESFGGAGIRVCDRWSDFTNFLMDMGEKPEGLYLNRRDKDGDFTPDNCFWSEHIDKRAMCDGYRLEGMDIADVKRQGRYIADLRAGNAPNESGFAQSIRRNHRIDHRCVPRFATGGAAQQEGLRPNGKRVSLWRNKN